MSWILKWDHDHEAFVSYQVGRHLLKYDNRVSINKMSFHCDLKCFVFILEKHLK